MTIKIVSWRYLYVLTYSRDANDNPNSQLALSTWLHIAEMLMTIKIVNWRYLYVLTYSRDANDNQNSQLALSTC